MKKINVLNLSIGGPDFMDNPFVDKVSFKYTDVLLITTTTTTTTAIWWPFVQDYLGEPIPEETFTHSLILIIIQPLLLIINVIYLLRLLND